VRTIDAGRGTQAKKLGFCVDIDVNTTTVKDVLDQVIVACACGCVEWGGTGPADCEADA
ncbi:hypothetical protein LY78DRAFT_592137, partial [Colletotrichum sublineola]